MLYANFGELNMRKNINKISDKGVPSASVVERISQEDSSIPNKISTSTKRIKASSLTPVTQVGTEKQNKKEKPRKVKMIRDSFTMPENEYNLLGELKKKCLETGVHVKKSELIRAGLINLSRLNKSLLLKAVERVEVIKTGRPKA